MFRNIRQLSLIGLTLTMGMISCHFPQFSAVLAQVNPSSANSETLSKCTHRQIRQWIYQLPEDDIQAFNNIVECDTKAIPELIKAINNQDKTIQIASIAILGEFGEDAKEAIPNLISLWRRNYYSDSDLEKVAIYTLEKIGKPAILVLISILEDKDEDRDVRSNVVEALGNMGENAQSAIFVLISILEDKDEDRFVRSGTVKALENILQNTQFVIPLLISILEDKDEDRFVRSYARSYAVKVLGNTEENTQLAIPVLISILKDKYVRSSAPSLNLGEPEFVANTTIIYKLNNPPVICQSPVIRKIVFWKCPEPSIANTANSSQPQNTNSKQNNSPASTSQPTKK